MVLGLIRQLCKISVSTVCTEFQDLPHLSYIHLELIPFAECYRRN